MQISDVVSRLWSWSRDCLETKKCGLGLGHRRNQPMGPTGRVPPNFWARWDRQWNGPLQLLATIANKMFTVVQSFCVWDRRCVDSTSFRILLVSIAAVSDCRFPRPRSLQSINLVLRLYLWPGLLAASAVYLAGYSPESSIGCKLVLTPGRGSRVLRLHA